MRRPVALCTALLLLLACALGSRQEETCHVTLRLVDSATGNEIPGLVSITDADGKRVPIAELLSHGKGLDDKLGTAEASPIHRWSVLPRITSVRLPRSRLTVEAVSGLETELARAEIDLTSKTSAELTIPLLRFDRPASRGYRSGNTHLHLQRVSREECDRYLLEIPRGDCLDVVFLSYLERIPDNPYYVSNQYTKGDLDSLTQKTGLQFGNGEEHRNNLQGYGEGYGHVMFLNIKELIQPVSIGPGIMKAGTDGIPLRRGIDQAHRDRATVVWCHNEWGMENPPNWVAGRLDAMNIFDDSIRSSYKDSFYRYLNIGLNVPFSTGTDWFIYDFSRVYVHMQGDVTVERWLQGLAEGKSFITNGPLLEFGVGDQPIGAMLSLEKPRSLPVVGRGRGRVDFGRIELIQNGRVIKHAASRAVGGHFEAELTFELTIDAPCWLALRTPPQPVAGDPQLTEKVAKNELGCDLFSHTSPIYIDFAGRRMFDAAEAQALLTRMNVNIKSISEKAVFADEQERERVLDVHREGIVALEKRIRDNAGPAVP